MPKVTRMMQLTAPVAGQRPTSNRSMNGAFTGKRAAPYTKFKPESAEADATPAPVPVRRLTPFGIWLKAFASKLAGEGEPLPAYKMEIYDYVMEGPPYRGDSLFGSKDLLKELGAKWDRNLDKGEDCSDKSIKRGWWAAGDDATLLRLLELDRDASGRDHWACTGMSSLQLGVASSWLRSFFGDTGTSTPAVDPPRPIPFYDRCRCRIQCQYRCLAGGEAWSSVVPDDDVSDWVRAAADGAHLTPWLPEPTCSVCSWKVMDQFLDCGCDGAKWIRCRTCTAIYRPGAPAPHDKCKC